MTGISYLFLGGNARSGTSALRQTLCAHADVAISDERYNKLWGAGSLTPAHFAPERFLNPQPGDSGNPEGSLLRPDIRDRYASARIVGDKVPPVWKFYEIIFERFAGARVVYILRNPLSMYDSQKVMTDDPARGFGTTLQRSVDEWNEGIARTLRFIEAGHPITVVPYERLWRSRESVMRLYAALSLPEAGVSLPEVDALVAKAARKLEVPCARNERQREYIFLNADVATYRRLLENHSPYGLDGLGEA